MRKIHTVALVGALMVAGCSSATEPTTTTTAPETTFVSTGSPEMDACIKLIADAVVDVDLDAPDVNDRLDEVLTDELLAPCNDIDDEQLLAEDLDPDEVFIAILENLPPEVVNWMSQPVDAPFEQVAPEL